ncbi:hypothetical protein GCK72_024910 [Caenorhabditis remanei]|uniref:Uncharacterized protein n=1 Tax=Caenorhabditis remanei TaxID=31234 RepID=A0A6A5G0W6_CAERE|nr:hypothetical protein GCK72_024910 [Caenorhabditis remanei]KAF1748443.1 hypothetical protein GCK72_024910 [Caenorhabditis remanei]
MEKKYKILKTQVYSFLSDKKIISYNQQKREKNQTLYNQKRKIKKKIKNQKTQDASAVLLWKKYMLSKNLT